MIYKFKGVEPKIGAHNFIADNATVIGDVVTEKDVSIWFSAVIRADLSRVYIGEKSNVQDNVTIHGDKGFDVVIGKNVTIGHNCLIHGCKIGDNCVIGMGSVLLDGAVIPNNSFIGANSLVTSSLVADEGYLILGAPAKAVKKLSERNATYLKNSSKFYVKEIDDYTNELERIK